MEYVEVERARSLPGLRLVLTEGGPGPWSEAAKGILHVKGLQFVAVRQRAAESNEALQAWTGQSSAPVAVWGDEPPCTTSRSILWLAERLAPEPSLIPSDDEDRLRCLGVCDEIHAENGLGWCRRLLLFDPMMKALGDAAWEGGLGFMARKYGYSAEAATRAERRIVQILNLLDGLLSAQRRAGRRHLVGLGLTAADIYWATFAAMLAPLPPDLCPMPDGLRSLYTVESGPLADALTPALLAHRDFVYSEHLRLPLEF